MLYNTHTEVDHSSIHFIRTNVCKVHTVLKVNFLSKQTKEYQHGCWRRRERVNNEQNGGREV